MAAPALFFHDGTLVQGQDLIPAEDTAKHIVQVLRMQAGDRLKFTDGKGNLGEAIIASAEKKKCIIRIEQLAHYEKRSVPLHLAVAFTKNASRNEWLLEKVAELGVETIIPLQTKRTEKEKFRFDRWKNILVSAMMQSQQYHLPELKESMHLDEVLNQFHAAQQLVAHCMADTKRQTLNSAFAPGKETLILIGPEGDFTEDEVKLCEAKGCIGISMGVNRLRTETAAMTACAYFNMVNNEERN